MILEALNFAASYPFTEAEFRPALKYSVNLWSRAGRCAKAWAPHEAKAKAAILQTVAGLSRRRTCVVLGSGLLRDVPVRELSRAFDTVVLFDLVHLASVRFQLAGWGLKNVRCLSRDLSGLAAVRSGMPPEPLAFLRSIPYLDCVISANLLSQIGVGTQKRLDREGKAGLPEDIVPRLLQAHLDGLRSVSAASLLLTDTAFRIIARDGTVEETVDLLPGLTLPKAFDGWDWPVAPLGEISKNYAVVHQVVALRLDERRRGQT